MTKHKIDFSQPLQDLRGEPIRRAGTLHTETLGAVAAALNSLPDAVRTGAIKAINEHVAQPLTLSEAVTSALVAIYEDESRPGALNGSERTTRLQLAMRCNKLGMVKLDDGQIKKIHSLVEKFFLGSLISPQVETLLQGKPWLPTLEDDDDDEHSEGASPESGG